MKCFVIFAPEYYHFSDMHYSYWFASLNMNFFFLPQAFIIINKILGSIYYIYSAQEPKVFLFENWCLVKYNHINEVAK